MRCSPSRVRSPRRSAPARTRSSVGGATPATCAGDVLEALGLEARRAEPEIPDDPAAEAVLAAIAAGAATPDGLTRATGLDAAELASALALLEPRGSRLARRGSGAGRSPGEAVLARRGCSRAGGTRARRAVDVAIVGAGITGCACALALAEAGLRVRVVDARRVAEGASGRNGGFALRGTAAPYDQVVAAVGRERALALWQWTEQELRRWRRWEGTRFADLAACAWPWTARSGRISATRSRRSGRTGWKPSGSTRRPGPSPAASPRLSVTRPDAALQPARLVRGLATRASAAGTEIVEGAVGERSIGARGRDRGHRDRRVSSGLLGDLEGLIIPTRGQVIATEPLAERLFESPHYGRHGFDYWHQTEDGRIVAGGFRDMSLEREFTAEEALTDDVQRALSAFVNDIVGRELRVDYRWAGIFGVVLDFLPVVGEVPGLPETWVAGGYSGHGNVLGFACGRLPGRSWVTATLCSTCRAVAPTGLEGDRRRSARSARQMSLDRPEQRRPRDWQGPGSRGPSSRRA